MLTREFILEEIKKGGGKFEIDGISFTGEKGREHLYAKVDEVEFLSWDIQEIFKWRFDFYTGSTTVLKDQIEAFLKLANYIGFGVELPESIEIVKVGGEKEDCSDCIVLNSQKIEYEKDLKKQEGQLQVYERITPNGEVNFKQ
ncbi:hypothetical protein LCGC14_3030920 [marine sediment metagenome]|uniref:Uncharacterized protein n=1 Tax=marine sediment metagenome TaxID=412755 RepID=A0A0F8WS96_9ZZZZ